MPKNYVSIDEEIKIIQNLYYAYYTPKEASEYLFTTHGKVVPAGTITKYYHAFKLSQIERFDRSKLIPS